jgi:aminopeptidase N
MIVALLALALQDPLLARADSVAPRHDALRYDIAVTLPDSGSRIAMTVATRWRLASPAPIRIDLDSVFTVRSVRTSGGAARWHRTGMQLYLDHGGGAGDTLTTEISYDGVPADGLVIRGSGDRRTIFADNWPDRARRWLAAQDHPGDKAAVGWTVTAPLGLTVVATGALTAVDTAGTRATWRFELADPVPVHTMVIGATRLATARMPDGGCRVRCVPVFVVSYPADSAFAVDGPFRRAGEMVSVFTDRFGEFPYPLLRHVETSTMFGGMENSTAIFYDERAWQAHRMGEGVVAHETAHQWFGDAVSQGDWHHLWLSEGFATYGAALWREHVDGRDGLARAMAEAAATVRQSPVRFRPILDTGEHRLMALLNDNNYPKGAWVLHSLRGLVGDSAFFRGLRTYYARYRNGNALSGDFAAVMSQVSGQDLEWYFRQALTQPGYPVLALAVRPLGDSAEVTLTQVQDAGWGEFRLPNLNLLVDGRLVGLPVSGRAATTRVAAPGGRLPELKVDPEGWWLLEVRDGRP